MKKKTSIGAICGFALLALSSCGNNQEFNTSTAENAIEDLPLLQDSANCAQLTVGYYEENDAAERLKLRKLASLGMVTYSAEQINEYIPAGYWSPAKTKEHVFVNVQLTDKGKKYIVTEPFKDLDAKELENPNKDKEFPEDTVAIDEYIPVINPSATGVTTPTNNTADNNVAATETVEDNYTPSTISPTSPYKAALEKVNTETFNMLAFKIDVKKVFNLICTDEMAKDGKAKCDVILECTDVTPFGRILRNVVEGDKRKETNINFVKYVDKGWQVDTNNK